MSEMTDAEAEQIDVAVVAYREDGEWSLQDLPGHALDSVELIARELRRYPGENGALAMLAVDEDFALLVRALGGEVKVLLSDADAATDWTLARDAVDHLGLVVEDDDEDEGEPAGDLDIVADLGLSAADMGELMDDYDLYPDELLSDIAARLGFGDRFDEMAGLVES